MKEIPLSYLLGQIVAEVFIISPSMHLLVIQLCIAI